MITNQKKVGREEGTVGIKRGEAFTYYSLQGKNSAGTLELKNS